MHDVITVGSATIDVFARTNFSELIKIIDPKGETDLLAFPSGSKILIDELEFTTGGGGTNTAVALSRLGHKVAFLGKLGNDSNSSFIVQNLKKEKINLICSHGNGNSGYSLVLDTLEHDRTILTYKGINDMLEYSEVKKKNLKAKWFYFSAMLHESFKTQEKLAQFAQKNNIKIAFNPSMYLAEKGADFLKNIMSRTHLLVLNKEEANIIVGNGRPEELLGKLGKLGPKIVAITDGKKEVYVFDGKFIYTSAPPKVKIVDTTGAGDAFAASFLSGLIKKNDIEFAIKLGIANSQSVISHYGAKNLLLSYNQAIRQIKKTRIKIRKKKI